MISENDLRIGNYIRSNPNGGEGTIIRIHTIAKNTVHGESLDGQLKNLKIDLDRWNDPIPLTPKILIAAGFEIGTRAGAIPCYQKDKFYLTDYDGFHFSCRTLNNDQILIEIKYVHQLQNLIHALTGTELKINL